MLTPFAAILCLLFNGVLGQSNLLTTTGIELEENMVEVVEHRENVGWPRIFEIFEVCEVTCQGKSCMCCHHVLNVVPVCGTLYINPTTKTAEISLTITGGTAFSAVFSIIPFLNFCQTTQTNLGDVDLCGNATISEHKNPDSFRLCIEAEVHLNKVKHLHVTVNCLEFNGDVIFESESDTVNGKNIASVKILNQIILVNEIRKAITDSLIG